MTRAPQHIQSRDNVLVKELRRLAHEPGAYRKLGRVWIEGDHLCGAALDRGMRPALAVFAESLWPQVPARWHTTAARTVVLADALFAGISGLESPARMGYVLDWSALQPTVQPGVDTVVLDRLQDAGNVGSILRSASAMGFGQVLALKGTAALWSPKVLRAGMGAHFALHLHEGLAAADLAALRVPLLVTHLQGDQWLHRMTMPAPCAWVFGHEGQGVQPALQQAAAHAVRIAQPGGEESLNVAAAAAICLYASAAARLAGMT